jgi:DNA repair protein RadC
MLKPIHKTAIFAALCNIRQKNQEHVLCLSIGSDEQLIACHTVAIGTSTSAPLRSGEIFTLSEADHATEIVLAHNHPSGSACPSEADVAATLQLVADGELFGIPVRDHVIIAEAEHFSFREYGLIR